MIFYEPSKCHKKFMLALPIRMQRRKVGGGPVTGSVDPKDRKMQLIRLTARIVGYGVKISGEG